MGQELMFDQYAYASKVRSEKAGGAEQVKKPEAAKPAEESLDFDLEEKKK
jgi:hypothetical protein